MAAPYRDELAALETRHAVLESEVADRKRARDEAARMLAEARARARNAEIHTDVTGGSARRRRRAMTIAAIGAILVFAGGMALQRATREPTRAQRLAEQRMTATLEIVEALTDEMCACTDKACGDMVQHRLEQWAQERARDHDDDFEPSRDFSDRLHELSERYVKCYAKRAP